MLTSRLKIHIFQEYSMGLQDGVLNVRKTDGKQHKTNKHRISLSTRPETRNGCSTNKGRVKALQVKSCSWIKVPEGETSNSRSIQKQRF